MLDVNMDHLTNIINLDYMLRITIAVIFGFCLGLERELTNKYAGLRTHILVCLGACVFTLISIYGFPTFAPGDNVVVDQATGIRDTSRVAAQIVTGIGFIGAGTVLRNGPIVLGLTTAATLWIAASIGMACGAGMFEIAFAGTLLSILTLVIVPSIILLHNIYLSAIYLSYLYPSYKEPTIFSIKSNNPPSVLKAIAS